MGTKEGRPYGNDDIIMGPIIEEEKNDIILLPDDQNDILMGQEIKEEEDIILHPDDQDIILGHVIEEDITLGEVIDDPNDIILTD